MFQEGAQAASVYGFDFESLSWMDVSVISLIGGEKAPAAGAVWILVETSNGMRKQTNCTQEKQLFGRCPGKNFAKNWLMVTIWVSCHLCSYYHEQDLPSS